MIEIEYLQHPDVMEAVAEFQKAANEKTDVAFNLFSLSSRNIHLEHFHSDVIATLLNPDGTHKQKDLFLSLFIEYLNKGEKIIDKNAFKNAEVLREACNIDIWIRDTVSKQSIIIENKMNDAVDADDQISRYIKLSENLTEVSDRESYKVAAAVYLTLDGVKKAPGLDEGLTNQVLNVGGFEDSESDLVNGWLKPCMQACNEQAGSSFIYQYIRLIKYLANNNLDKKAMESLYKFMGKDNGLEIINSLLTMASKMVTYRRDKFMDNITNYSPFKKSHRYNADGALYNNYLIGDDELKIDVYFEEKGGAYLVLWNPKNRTLQGRDLVTTKLIDTGLLEEFREDVTYGSGYWKKFDIGDVYKNMCEVDDAITVFVKRLMEGLRNRQ
jgi:hypothetical protein